MHPPANATDYDGDSIQFSKDHLEKCTYYTYVQGRWTPIPVLHPTVGSGVVKKAEMAYRPTLNQSASSRVQLQEVCIRDYVDNGWVD